MAEKEIVFESEKNGDTVKIANDVIITIAMQALRDIEGVTLTNAVSDSIMDKIVKKNPAKAIRIYNNDETNAVDMDVHVAVSYGVNIPEVSWRISDAVKKNMEMMTDVSIGKINVFADNLLIEKEPKKSVKTPVFTKESDEESKEQ